MMLVGIGKITNLIFYYHLKFRGIGFNFLQNTFYKISPHYAVRQFFLAFMSMYFLLKIQNYILKINKLYHCLYFFCIPMFLYFSVLRQAIAISIFQ